MAKPKIFVLAIALLGNLANVEQASGKEPFCTFTDKPQTNSLDPAELNRSDMFTTDLLELEAEFVKNIEHMLNQITVQYPTEESRPPIVIKGFSNPDFGTSQSRQLEGWIWRRDTTKLLYFMQRNLIAPLYERLDNGALQFESKLEASTGPRLSRAIENSDFSTLDNILDNEQPDLERYLQRHPSVTPLQLAVSNDNVTAVRKLLSAGANPDTKARGGSDQPLLLALQNGNDELVRLLLEAGANLDIHIGSIPRMPPIAWAIANNRMDYVALLIEFGADPDKVDHDGWTPLMSALFHEQIEVINALLPLTDPLIIFKDDITRDHRTKKLGLRFLPRGNALFLAQRMRSQQAATIAEAVRARAKELHPEEGLKLLELSVQRSASKLAWFNGQKQDAIDAHRAAIAIADVPSFATLTHGRIISQAMEMLTELHEMLLITGQTMSDQEKAYVTSITDMGGWHAPLHDMLNIVAAGQHDYPADLLNAWRAAYGTPHREDWNFDRLNTWVETITDTSQRNRLFDVLDFFELMGWQR